MLMFNSKVRIRRYLGSLIGYYLLASGLARKARQKVLSNEYITPVYFHNPTKENFIKCISWLKENGYVFLSSEELVAMLNGKMAIPKGAIWISFDDGWSGNLGNAIPTILEYDIPATFFISTDPVERSGVFWWSIVQKYEEHLPIPYKNDGRKLWKIREEERAKIIGDLEQRFLKGFRREAMTVGDIKHIANNPQITIGCHTVHHAIMPNCTDSELEFEIKQSKSALENWTGKQVNFFSYPNGDFDGREKKVLQKYGFELSATIEKRFIFADDDVYLIPRFSVPDNATFPEAMCRMLGIFNPFITMGKAFGMAP